MEPVKVKILEDGSTDFVYKGRIYTDDVCMDVATDNKNILVVNKDTNLLLVNSAWKDGRSEANHAVYAMPLDELEETGLNYFSEKDFIRTTELWILNGEVIYDTPTSSEDMITHLKLLS